MPRYDFGCKECGEVVEKWIPLADYNKPLPCPICKKGEMVRLPSKGVAGYVR